MADAGADVAVTSRNGDDAEPVAREIRAKGRRSLALLLDVRHALSIRVCFERLDREWGSLDTLVNSAGVNIPQDLASIDESSWDTVVDTDDPTTLALAELDAGGSAKYRLYADGTEGSGLAGQE